VTNQIRLMQDNGVVSVASAADFLLRTHDRIDIMLHRHLILKETEKVVLSLVFVGLRNFDTVLPESSLTLQKTVVRLLTLLIV
jgi:hypothetical protein